MIDECNKTVICFNVNSGRSDVCCCCCCLFLLCVFCSYCVCFMLLLLFLLLLFCLFVVVVFCYVCAESDDEFATPNSSLMSRPITDQMDSALRPRQTRDHDDMILRENVFPLQVNMITVAGRRQFCVLVWWFVCVFVVLCLCVGVLVCDVALFVCCFVCVLLCLCVALFVGICACLCVGVC